MLWGGHSGGGAGHLDEQADDGGEAGWEEQAERNCLVRKGHFSVDLFIVLSRTKMFSGIFLWGCSIEPQRMDVGCQDGEGCPVS